MKNNYISINNWDRCSLPRKDKNWINEKLQDKKSRIIPVYRNKVLLSNNDKAPEAAFITYKDIAENSDVVDTLVFLGIYERTPYFAVEIKSDEAALSLSQNANGVFKSIRWIVSLLNVRDCELLTLAGFMIYWHSRNQYCGKCGSETKSTDAGHVRICKSQACKESYFPSMDPAVIVLVSKGEKCLLGRQKMWPEKMYSTLAGFVEPGEKIEDAVKREIMEEVGISVDNIKYQGSQPWLFPSSLMLGFTATAKEEVIIIDNTELEDARWFTREELTQNPEMLPGKVSIARKLIMDWIGQGA
jgi:NAD+ diphosphatase